MQAVPKIVMLGRLPSMIRDVFSGEPWKEVRVIVDLVEPLRLRQVVNGYPYYHSPDLLPDVIARRATAVRLQAQSHT